MKVLKIAAIVVGVAVLAMTGVGLAVGGLSLGMAFGVGAAAVGGALGIGATAASMLALSTLAIGVSALVSAVMPKPSMGGQQTKWKADPYAGIPYVMGRTLAAGNMVLRRGHGKENKYNTFVTVLSLGAIASIDATFMDKSRVNFSANGNATGQYAGMIYQRTQLGRSPETAALTTPVGNPPGWTSAHKLSGLAAVMNSYVYDAKEKKGITQIPQPSHIVRGVLVYDPRLDSTYPGGSGPCRAYDESTYVWSENPQLHGLTWALGRYQNGVRVAGIGAGEGVPGGRVSSVDVATFVEGANLSDARGWKLGGQVYTRPDTAWNSLSAMLQAGGSRPVLIGNRITCLNRAPKVSLATIKQTDIIGECSFSGTQRRRVRINGVIPQYRSEQHDWELVSAKEVSIPAFVVMDGDERTREISYPLVQQVNQVAQLAAYDLYDAREAGPGTVPLGPAWLNYKVGDCLTFEPEDGLSIKTMVCGRALDPASAAVTMQLVGETDAKHPYCLGQTGTPPPIASFTYDASMTAPTAAEWSVSAVQLGNGDTLDPIVRISGQSANPNAEAILIEYREPDSIWHAASIEAPAMSVKDIAGLKPLTTYEIAISYRGRGQVSDRLLLGPVITGNRTTDANDVTINGTPLSDAYAAALALAKAKGKLWTGATRPTLAQSNIGDTWIDPATGLFHERVSATGILLGGTIITLNGKRPIIGWTLSANQPLAPVLATAQAAYADANEAIDALTDLADDGILSVHEKITVLIPEQARLEAKWAVLFGQAGGMGVSTTAASSARNAWNALLASISPAWNNADVDSPVNRSTFRSARDTFDAALYDLDKAIKAAAATLANWSGVNDDNGNKPADGATRNLPRGTYSPVVEYLPGDSVVWATETGGTGHGYARQGTGATTGVAPSDGSKWALSVQASSGGPAGPAGQSLYVWAAYANSANGSVDFTTDPANAANRSHYGLAFNRTTQTPGTDPNDYVWREGRGPQGVQGIQGVQGNAGPVGQDGTDFEWIFLRSIEQPATPVGNGIPSPWSDDIPPDDGRPLWMSGARKLLNGDLKPGEAWLTPVPFAENQMTLLVPSLAAATSARVGQQVMLPDGSLYRRVSGTGILLGGKVVTLNGKRPRIEWVLEGHQPIWDVRDEAQHANSKAQAALDVANAATERLAGLDDDGKLTIDEKIRTLIPLNAELESAYSTLVSLATPLAISTTALALRRNDWIALRNSISPPWNDTNQETQITRNSWDAALLAYRNELDAVQRAVAEGGVARIDPAAKSLSFKADYQGNIAGDLPKAIKFTRIKGNIDVSGSASWSIVDLSPAGSATATISAEGLLTLTAINQTGSLKIRSLRDGITIDSPVDWSKTLAPPPATGSGGGSIVSDTSFNDVSGTSFTPISDLMTVKTGGTGAIEFTANLSVYALAAQDAGTFPVEAKWQFRAGGGSFTDVAAATASNPHASVYNEGGGSGGGGGRGGPWTTEVPIEDNWYTSSEGWLACSTTKSGLSANTDYEVQLVARRTASFPAKTLSFSGSATAKGS